MKGRHRRGRLYKELEGVKPLLEYSEGKELEVVGVRRGRDRRKLMRRGIVSGREIKILHKGFGPLLVSVAGIRMSIGKGLSRKILAKEKSSLEERVE